MASLKTEKPAVGTQLFGQAKKEPATAKASEGGSKSSSGSKSGGKKAAQKPQEPKKKGKGGKSAKH